jgi:hypothetical protein
MRGTRWPCCARAVSGHAAAPPTSVMKSRRRRQKAICPSRARTPVDQAVARASTGDLATGRPHYLAAVISVAAVTIGISSVAWLSLPLPLPGLP